MQIRRIAPNVYMPPGSNQHSEIRIVIHQHNFLCVNKNQFPTIVSCVWPRINNSLLFCEAVTIHRLTVQILALTKFFYNCHLLPPDIVNRPSLPVLQPPAGSAPHPEQPYSLHHHAYDIKLENFFFWNLHVLATSWFHRNSIDNTYCSFQAENYECVAVRVGAILSEITYWKNRIQLIILRQNRLRKHVMYKYIIKKGKYMVMCGGAERHLRKDAWRI
jgi:hypothetical protein